MALATQSGSLAIHPIDGKSTPVDEALLHAHGAAQEQFHAHAAATAREHFGRKVFIRAVVEVSSYCREDCHYCGMRRSNRELARYRARHEDLAELIIHHRPSTVTDVNIQTGEDPVAVEQVVLPLLRTLRRETNLGLSVCLGTLTESHYRELQAAGASIYIMKFEMADAAFYRQLGAPGTLPERVDHIRHLASRGWKVSSGFIAGLPEQTDSLLSSNFALAASLPLAGCSVSPFIPGESTPLVTAPGSDINLTLNCMAGLRLMRPDWIIPSVSALNLAEPGQGYARGLRTGANLVTINMTPPELRTNYLLYRKDRFIMTEERILSALATENLEPSTRSLADYLRGSPAAAA